MPKILQLRRGTTAELAANTPASGELFVDIQQKTVTVGDGSLAGGTYLATDARVSAAFNTANGANGLAAGAFNTANGANGLAAGAFNTANGANGLAQGAFNVANTKFDSTGGVISGSVTISANNNLTVTGNLTVLGNTFSISTQTLEVVDPMIILANGNFSSDAVDIGFAGHYNDGSNAHTGLFRDYASKDWYLFQGYTPELTGNNEINIGHVSFDTANLIAKRVNANVVATTVIIAGRNQASVDSTQNTNIAVIQGVDNTQNTNIAVIQGVDNTQNTRLNSIETINNNQNTSITVIQGVDNTQNTRLNSIETINNNQNTSITYITGVNVWQNTEITAVNQFAQAAYNQANTGGGGGVSPSGYLANTVITANSSGYLGNTSNLIFNPSNQSGYPELTVVDSQKPNLNVITISPSVLDMRTGTNNITDSQLVRQTYDAYIREKYHGGLNGGGVAAYGGRNRYEVRQLYANTTDATMVFASYTGNQASPQDYAGAVANGEVSIFETTIIAQSQGAAGSNAFDGTKIWKYETTYSKTPTISLSDTISTQVSNTGNSGTWVANLYFNTSYASGDGINIAVQGEAGKQIFWYVTTTQKSLWCTFAQAGGGGGGSGK